MKGQEMKHEGIRATRHLQAGAPFCKHQFDALVADFRQNGYKGQPILLYEGKVLDGWHRYRACLEAGVEPRFETFHGTLYEAWEESHRRNNLLVSSKSTGQRKLEDATIAA